MKDKHNINTMSTRCFEFKVMLFIALFFVYGFSMTQAQTDVTDYETVTVSIPATGYDASKGPEMARVKYNKTFPLVITSDDMGKTELTNNWAEVNGYPNVSDNVDLGIQPGGSKLLAAPYKKYYMQHESSDVSDYQPMTYTDNVGKKQRYRMTSAIMPFELANNSYAKISADDAKLMLRTGWSFAQHDVNDISSVSAISSAMTTNNTTWTNAVGIGLKVMVEPNGNHKYLDAGRQNDGICWNIFQNPNSEYPGNSKTLTSWTNSRTDWSASGIQNMPTTFSSKPTGGYARTFFQGNESAWKAAVDAADGTSMIIGGTHGLGDDIKNHLRTSSNVTGNAWVCGADEAWEYYHIYNKVKIENVSWDNTNKKLTFDIQVPTYNKNQFRELTLNIPGLTGTGAPTFSTASGKTVPVTGGFNADGGTGIGYTMNIGLETSINTYIEQLMTIYRDDQTNAFVKRDLEYLISQLWDGPAKTNYQNQLDVDPTYDLTVQSSLGTTLATIKTDTNGDKSFAVPRYIVDSNKLYEHTANGTAPYYVNTIATSTGTPSAVSYAEKAVTGNAVLFVEGEDMTGATVVGCDFDNTTTSDPRYYAMRLASMGMGGCIVSGTPAAVTNSLPRGKYKLVIGYGDSYTGNSSTYNVCVGGSSIYEFNNSGASNQAVTEFTTGDFDIEVDNTPVTITSDYTNDHPEKGNRWIDYVYIIKTADLAAAVPTMTFTKSTAAATVKTGTTATLTATAVPNGGSGLTTAIYAADSEGTPSGDALATGSTDVTYNFTPSSDGTYYFVAQSTNSAGTTTSELITLTATSITNYTLNIVDKSGNIAMSATIANPGSPAETDPLPDAYRSPFAENYHYYLTAADAQSNNTTNALANTDAWSDATIYVGYDVKSTFGSDKKYAIWADNNYMHMVYRPLKSGETYRYNLEHQKYDIFSETYPTGTLSVHTITPSNYALLDNSFMWQLGNDPYNITFKSVSTGYYNNPIEEKTPANCATTSTNSYSILYWSSYDDASTDTNADYCRIYYRGSESGTPLFVEMAGGQSNGRWIAKVAEDKDIYNKGSKIYFKPLDEVTVNVLDSLGNVEAQIQAYNNPAATMQSFVPYSMLRAYTSGHAFYYDPSHSDAVTASAVLNTNKLEANGSNLYMTYSINDDKWRTVVKDSITYNVHSFDAATDDDANWYGLRYNKTNTDTGNYIMASALLSNLGTTDLANITGTNADTDNGKKGQWVLIGTPYHLELANRYLGIDNLLGIPSDATSSSKAQVRAAGTSGVITTWETVTWLNEGKSHLFFRPQGGFNGQAPNLYLSGPSGLADKAKGGEMWDFYWAAETTEHQDPAATLTLSAASTNVYVDYPATLTATATPAAEHSVTYFAIERETATDTWEVIGTAYSGENVSGASKDEETGVVTVTCSYSPTAEGTFNFRARAICDDAENNTILSTNPARDGGMGSAVSITATVAPFVVGSDNYTLKLIDKDGNELFTESNVPKSRVQETNLISGRNADPIADSWRSPLVTRYYYYSTKADAQANSGSNLFDWSSTAATPTVYVGYEVSDAIDLNSTHFSDLSDLMTTRVTRGNGDNTRVRNADSFGKMYMLKFKTSEEYNLEDGNDNRNTTATPANTLIYPYTNGDGPIYMYSHQRYLDQKDNGASTRTRWPWYLVSPTGDPYHVYITSWQNSHSDGGTNYYSYLRTYYNSTYGKVVTNNVTDSIISGNAVMPTDYMILRGSGTDGLNYKLVTAGTITDGSTTERRTVNSIEQYWRTNPTAQRYLNITPGSQNLTSAQETTLEGLGWHKYAHYAKAATATNSTKTYESADHWFMTVSLGDGSLDIVETNIDGVLVLLDNHGWEIMRQPIVEHDDPDYSTVQAALKKYDSPMVKNYKFYSARNVNHKVAGYHKYNINNGANKALTESARVNGTTTYTSLADYPESMQGGALTDLYVTYDVKDEYKNSYVGAATEAATSASSFLLRQGSNYAKASGSSITTTTDAAAADSWYLKPNFNIDREMGYQYDVDVDGLTTGTILDEATTNTNYVTDEKAGFDPYNLRIQHVTDGTYFTTNATSATLGGGIWTGNGTTLSLTDASSTYGATGYDQTTLAVTNATFMAVQDGNGNMRLMPRFQHEEVVQGFTALAGQAADQSAGNTTHAQTTLLTTPVTYHIIDNSGADVFGALSYEGAGFAVPKEYQSPMVEQYYYHNSLEDAQTNRTTSNVNTVSPNDVVYVSYKVSDDFNADKAYTIYGANSYMHACYRYGIAEDDNKTNYLWWMQNQKVDRDNGNAISLTTLPFLDNTYAWQVGETPDPYNVRFLNKGAHRYLNQSTTGNDNRMEQLAIIETEGEVPATATPFCILYYGDDTDDCTLYNRTYDKYVYDNNGDWRANDSRTGDNRRLTITELPAISINVVNAAKEVECTLEGFYKSGCTWTNSFTPFYLQRIYTSGHTFYYTLADAAAGTNAISGTVNDNTIATNKAVYVKYTLSSDWGAAVDDDDLTAKKTAQTIKVMPSPSNDKINWYAIRTTNSKTVRYLEASQTTLPANLSGNTSGTNATTDADADANKLAQWALIGTPYNLKLVDRYHGMSNYLGISEDAANRSFAFIDDGTADITTWEVCTGYSSNDNLLIRPQRSLNGETPYLYIGWNGGAGNMSLAVSTGVNQGLDLTWVKQTDAKTLTFKLYDKDGTYMSPTVSDFTLTGVSAGDDLAAAFGHTDLKRRYCEYTFYSSYDEQTQTLSNPVTEAGTNPAETIYVKWDYTDDAPVFSTGSETRDYQYYMVSVHNGSNSYMMNVTGNSTDGYNLLQISTNHPHTTLKEGHTQFALVGNPYAFKLYSRYAGKNLRTNSSGAGLTFLDALDEVATTEAVFDLPIPVNTSITRSTQMDVRMKAHPDKHIWGTASEFWMGSSTGCFAQLMYMVVPVRVFQEGSTALANIVDYQEYALDLNPSNAAVSTDARITDADLYPSTQSGSANYYTKDFRHAFCDYTFYHTYDWSSGTLSNAIPTTGTYAGLPYYGGSSDQFARAFFATYTVDEEQFSKVYLLDNANSGTLKYFGSGATTSGDNVYYPTVSIYNTVDAARNDDTNAYRWLMTGDPYNLQLTCLGTGDDYEEIPLGVTNVSTTNDEPTQSAGTLALLTNNATYAQKSHWEVILNNDGNHIFYLVDDVTTYDDEDRYTYSLGTFNYMSTKLFASSDKLYTLHLTPAVPQYDVVWKVMEGSSGSYTEVASYTKENVSKGTTLTLADMPEILRRHFCKYENMYSNEACTTQYAGNEATVDDAELDIYVPYTLAAGAPMFYESVATFNAATGNDKDPVLIRLNHANYAYTTAVTDESATTTDSKQTASTSKWVLIGSPYNVKLYNILTGKYLYVNWSNISPNAVIPMDASPATGTTNDTWTILDDATGDYAVLCLKEDDNHQMLFIGYDGSGNVVMNIPNSKSEAMTAEFLGSNGIDNPTLVLHYGANTLRQDANNNSMAGQTENFQVSGFFNLGTPLVDIMPSVMKRPFCNYTFKYNDVEYEAVVKDPMCNASQPITIHVYYTRDESLFKWSTATTDYTGKYWYYLVNNHVPAGSSEQGKMYYRDSSPKLRVSEALVQNKLYLNNYEWCVIGDPYGFKMLNHYDPDRKFSEYIRVMDYNDNHVDGLQLEQNDDNDDQNIFEMMPGTYSYNFWMHPVYSSTQLAEYAADSYSFVSQNYNGSAAIIPTGKKTMAYLKTNSSANLRLEILSDATLKEYLKYAGFVGGLKYDVANNESLVVGDAIVNVATIKANVLDGTATDAEKTMLHNIINNPANIEQMVQGYYRIVPFTQEGGSEHNYIRGYIDEDEKNNSGGMNSNLKVENQTTAEYDPASIFWFDYTTSDGTANGYPRYYVRTQGLSMNGNVLGANDAAYKCRYEDLGAAITQLKISDTASSAYLSCTSGAAETSTNQCFDEQAGNYKTRLYLQKVNNTNENEMAFKQSLNKGHNGRPLVAGNEAYGNLPYTYASLYVPFDLQVSSGLDDEGNILTPAQCDLIPFIGIRENYHPSGSQSADTYYEQGEYALICQSIDEHQKVVDWVGSNLYIPAATPVINRSRSGMTEVTYVIPTTTPSTDNESLQVKENCLKGTYVEKYDNDTQIRVFGKESVKINGTKTYTGRVGLFQRSNPESTLTHNKPYYVENVHSSATPSTSASRGVMFTFEQSDLTTGISDSSTWSNQGDDALYDMQGRKLSRATKAGVYIMNGRKIVIKK